MEILGIVIGFIGTILGSGFIQFLINRHDAKKEKNSEVDSKLDKIIKEQEKAEKDLLRVQLLVMMNLMPDNHEEIMTLGQRYFDVLDGDWFYSSLFAKWLKDNNIEKPLWFNKDKDKD